MKPLNILLGNNTLSLLAGSETHTLTLAMQLKEMGHRVSCFSPELGIISEKLIEAGIPCYSGVLGSGIKPFSYVLEEKVDHKYDVIIANHFHIVEALREQFPKTPIISTIHGVLHFMDDAAGNTVQAPEHPSLRAGVNQFVAVSEEVQKKLKDDHTIDSVIIRNFIDVKKFGKLRPATENKPKQFFINTNYAGAHDPEIEVVREAAKYYGARVAAVGVNFTQSIDVSKAIEESDVVFGMGRSVMEGVAAGRLGIVHGRWGTGGVVRESAISELRSCNFSGRNSGGKQASAQEIIAMIEQYYHPQFLSWGKEYVARDHNAVFAAEEYVRLARELTGGSVFRTTARVNEAVAPDARPFRLAKS